MRLLAWILTGLLVYLPLLIVLLESFLPEGRLSLEHYRDLAGSRLPSLFFRSVGMAGGAALIALVLGVILAFFLETRRVPFRPALRLAALAPLLLPPYMQVAAWKPILGNLIIQEEWIRAPAVILILGIAHAPLVFFFASQGIRGISGNLLDDARLAPVPERVVAARIILPLAAPAILAGACLTFILAFLDLETPALLLAPGYTMEIFHRAGNPAAAFAAATPVIALSLAVACLAERWARQRGFSVSGSENPSAPLPLQRAEPPVILILCALGGLLVLLPLVRLSLMAGSPGVFVRAWELYGAALVEGIPITLGSAALATLLAAMILGRSGKPSPAASLLAWIPLAVPGTVLGAALIEIYNRPVLEVVYGSRWILVISSAARFFPIAFHALAAHLRGVPREFWENADLAAISAPARLMRIYLPLAAPGLALSAAAVAILQSGELAAAMLIAPPGHRPVPVVISSELHYNVNLDIPAALCLFQVAVVLCLIGVIRIAARRLVAGRGERYR